MVGYERDELWTDTQHTQDWQQQITHIHVTSRNDNKPFHPLQCPY